ncbi:type IV pilus secretin family protein [Anaeromyxobacter dehalogenans]|uniref:Type II and III secretion system protein, secretin n=1 Tax=Anaeromyxobacter dehalogenans (strain 2CP-C) TaxID=290397 RepID=Q2INN8_ANADE|nr:type IV pilus secretin family protein [Anaeromyxobacter dehalogenans]ABC80421.1 type II and III secretion system protein, secretin [Anaeromyxobacter dehalogenans 2CP-C]
MTSRLKPIVGLLLWGAIGVASAAEPNVIRGIEVGQREGALELEIRGSRAPSYSVFKLQDPPRLVVDLAGADVSGVTSPIQVGKAGVLAVSTAQYKDERSAVGRVIIALDGARRYDVAPRGDAVVVRVLEAEAASVPTQATASAPKAPAPAAAPPAAPASSGDDHLVAHRVDEGPAGTATRITGVRAAGGQLVIATDGQAGRLEILELRDPARLAIDVHGVSGAPRAPVKVRGAFSQVRFGRDAGKVRVVLDASGALPRYEVKRVAGGVAVVTSGATVAAAEPARKAVPAPRVEPVAPAAAPAAPGLARIGDVRFASAGGGARIDISGKAPFVISRPDAHTVVLTLDGAQLPRALERSLDTSAFRGPVAMVSSFNQPQTGQVRIVASLRGNATDRMIETRDGLAWTFSEAGEAAAEAAAPAAPEQAQAADAKVAGFAAEAPAYASSGAPQARGYTGRRITLDFHDIEIRNLLRLIADVSKKNIVVADDVSGKVTVSLRNVPWDQALDLVLRSKGLGKEEMGNVIRIAKFEAIAKEQAAKAEAEKARIPLIPLKVRIIPVNYARANDVASRVKDVLSERGSVSTDERTNVLIVKDIPEALVRAEGLVRNLDTEIPQVLIESRIVEASSNFNRQLGVQWGGNASFTQATGNPTGVAFPNNVSGAGAAGQAPNQGTSATPNYAVNLPAAIGQGAGGGIGLVLGSANGAFNLNLRLSALENNGVVKTISSPKIATIDNKEATIGQGISIPFSQTSASGVNTTFVEAKLELKVTPHVTADGSILLKIKATNNAPNSSLTGSNGQPSISKREAETEVLVKDGETTVIGGIYTRSTASKTAAVPFLSKIPLLGFFFRSDTNTDDHTELLIFITPRILNRQPATAAAAASN